MFTFTGHSIEQYAYRHPQRADPHKVRDASETSARWRSASLDRHRLWAGGLGLDFRA